MHMHTGPVALAAEQGSGGRSLQSVDVGILAVAVQFACTPRPITTH